MKLTKDVVLAMLKQSTDYLSGEDISKALGISRAAVNTAVQSLRQEGYAISSSTKKGYLLNSAPDKLNRGELLAILPAQRVERILCLESAESTNATLRQLAQSDAADGMVVVANEQTKGRGRLGRRFESPKDKGIYLSMLMRLDSAPSEAVSITAWVAVAICRAIEAVCGVRMGIKWVNDLVLGGQKLCGILTEMSIESESEHVQHIVTGIGVNVNHTAEDFPEELQAIASSLAIKTGKPVSRAALTAAMIESLDRMREDWPRKRGEYLQAYRERCVTVGNEVRILKKDEALTGIAEGVDEDFGLVVRFADGHVESVTSGEVSVRGLYGYV